MIFGVVNLIPFNSHLQKLTPLFLHSQFECLLFFSCLIALARTSSTVLNNSGENVHPCLVPDLRGKAFTFSPLTMILAKGR